MSQITDELSAYEAQVLIGTSISGCNIAPDRVFDLKDAWARLYAMGLIDRTDGLAIATPKGGARIAAMLAAQDTISTPSVGAETGESVALPERDVTRPAEQQGLFRKFDIRRVDGSDAPGGKHHGCRYFVLDVEHDPHSVPALIAYAAACEATHPQLAKDLRSEWQIPRIQK